MAEITVRKNTTFILSITENEAAHLAGLMAAANSYINVDLMPLEDDLRACVTANHVTEKSYVFDSKRGAFVLEGRESDEEVQEDELV